MKGLSMWPYLVTRTADLGDARFQGDGLASVGAADALPVFVRIVKPTLADAFWAAGAATATLFADLLAKWCSRIAACFASEAAPEAATAFFVPASRFLSLEGIQYRHGSRHSGTFGIGN